MPFEKTIRSLPKAARNASSAARQGLGALRSDKAIVVYPLFVFILVLGSLAVVNDLISSATTSLAQESLFGPEQYLAFLFFGITSIILFYIYLAVMTGCFTCVVAASVMAQLDGHPTPLLRGIKVVLNRLPRIAAFSALSIFFIPLGLIAQRSKVQRKPHDAIGSSFSLNMAQLAPAILSGNKGVFETIRHSVNVMGEAWKENLMIKASMYGFIIFLGLVSFLPGYIERNWFDKTSAGTISWLVSVILLISFLIMTRVLASVFTATLYWRLTKSRT
ncbi:hypothetical protein H0X09_00880 [Candidatus Saccharibacteria bacterium]|nr:hypothetical protein [Candidatus Saccharibacteria bacterium]